MICSRAESHRAAEAGLEPSSVFTPAKHSMPFSGTGHTTATLKRGEESLREFQRTGCQVFQATLGSFDFLLGPVRRIQVFYDSEMILIVQC